MARTTIDRPRQERRLRMSYEEFLAWADEDVHAEWVDGEVTVFVTPGTRHQRIALFLIKLLSFYVDRFGLGEVMVAPFEMRILGGRSSRAPDILFVRRERLDRIDRRRLEGPADLVVEIVSDESVRRDRSEKLKEYQEAGVAEYWIVDARDGKEEFVPYRLAADGMYEAAPLDADGRYSAATVPGFWLRPAWLWMDPLPEPIELVMTTIAPHIVATFASPPSIPPRADDRG